MWFPDNQGDKYTGSAAAIDRNNLPINVYDADEVAISSLISLPDELNYIDAKTIDGTINNPTGHAITDLASGQPAIDSGFVLFQIADYARLASEGAVSRAGISFSLVGLGTSASSAQVQTDLAHERGLVPNN